MAQSRQGDLTCPEDVKSPEKRAQQPTVAQSVVTGSVAGAVEVFVDHPLWTMKTRMQQNQPFTLKLSLLYRGILPNAASMVPITAIQVGLNRSFQKAAFLSLALFLLIEIIEEFR